MQLMKGRLVRLLSELRESLGRWPEGAPGREGSPGDATSPGHTGTLPHPPTSCALCSAQASIFGKGALEMMGREGRERVGDGDVGIRFSPHGEG